MHRRQLLAATSLAIAGLAGCNDDNDQIKKRSRDETESITATTVGEDPDTESTVETPTDAPEASLDITNHHKHVEKHDDQTDVYVEAFVDNSGTVRSGSIELQADWYDEDGNRLDYDRLWLRTLHAGETWEARVYYLGGEPEAIADYEIDVEFSPAEGTLDPAGLTLHSTEMQVRADEGDVAVRGEVENTSGSDQHSATAIAKFYDDDGLVLGDNHTTTSDFLVGGTWQFKVWWTSRDRTDRIDSYEVLLADTA